MKNMNRVRSFFDKAATNYQTNSDSWPWCWLRSKERSAVLKLLGTVSGKTVLDVGSGAGYYTRMALDLGATHVVALDFSQNMINQLPKNNVTGLVGDASQIKLEKRFSHFIMAGLLEFAPDPSAVFANMFIHAQNGADMIVLAPKNNIWGRIYKRYHRRHEISINLFTTEDLLELGERVGWDTVSVKHVFPFSMVVGFKAAK